MDSPSWAAAAVEEVGQRPDLPASGPEGETGKQAAVGNSPRERLQC